MPGPEDSRPFDRVRVKWRRTRRTPAFAKATAGTEDAKQKTDEDPSEIVAINREFHSDEMGRAFHGACGAGLSTSSRQADDRRLKT